MLDLGDCSQVREDGTILVELAGWDKTTKGGDLMLGLSVKPHVPRLAAPVDDSDLDRAMPERR